MPPNRSKIALGARQVIDQHHGPGAIGAGVEAERRPLPVDAHIAGILRVERAVAIAQAADKSAAGFFTKDVAVRLPPLIAGLFHERRQAARDAAEKVMAGIDDLAGGELIAGAAAAAAEGRRARRPPAVAVPGFAPAPATSRARRQAPQARPTSSRQSQSARLEFIERPQVNPLLTGARLSLWLKRFSRALPNQPIVRRNYDRSTATTEGNPRSSRGFRARLWPSYRPRRRARRQA